MWRPPCCSAPALLARGGPASRRLAKASRPLPRAAGEVGPAGRPSGTEGRAGWRGCGAGSVPRGARASVPGDLRGVCAGLLPEATSSCTPPSSHQSVPQLCAQGVTRIHLSSPRDLARPSRGPPGWTPPAVGLGLSLALCVPCALGQRAHPLVPQFPHLHALSHERRDGGGIVAASGRGLRPPSPEAAPRSVISSRTPLNFSHVRSVTPGQPSCLLGECPPHDVAETRASVMGGTRPRAPRPFRAPRASTRHRPAVPLLLRLRARPCRGARRRRRGRSPSLRPSVCFRSGSGTFLILRDRDVAGPRRAAWRVPRPRFFVLHARSQSSSLSPFQRNFSSLISLVVSPSISFRAPQKRRRRAWVSAPPLPRTLGSHLPVLPGFQGLKRLRLPVRGPNIGVFPTASFESQHFSDRVFNFKDLFLVL